MMPDAPEMIKTEKMEMDYGGDVSITHNNDVPYQIMVSY